MACKQHPSSSSRQHLQLQDLGRLMEAAIEAGQTERLARDVGGRHGGRKR